MLMLLYNFVCQFRSNSHFLILTKELFKTVQWLCYIQFTQMFSLQLLNLEMNEWFVKKSDQVWMNYFKIKKDAGDHVWRTLQIGFWRLRSVQLLTVQEHPNYGNAWKPGTAHIPPDAMFISSVRIKVHCNNNRRMLKKCTFEHREYCTISTLQMRSEEFARMYSTINMRLIPENNSAFYMEYIILCGKREELYEWNFCWGRKKKSNGNGKCVSQT